MRRIDRTFAAFRGTSPRHRVLRAKAVRVIRQVGIGYRIFDNRARLATARALHQRFGEIRVLPLIVMQPCAPARVPLRGRRRAGRCRISRCRFGCCRAGRCRFDCCRAGCCRAGCCRAGCCVTHGILSSAAAITIGGTSADQHRTQRTRHREDELSPGDGANELFHRFSHICVNFRGVTRPRLLARLENPSFKPTQAPRHGSAAVSRTPIIGPEGEMRQGLWTPKCAAFGRKTRGRMSCGHAPGWTRCGTRRR